MKMKLDLKELIRNSLCGNTELGVSRSSYGGHWVSYLSDKHIGKSLRKVGHFQESAISKCLEHIKHVNYTSTGNIFFEIGSNIGTHSIFALRNGFKYAYCFEPDPNNFKLLKVNQILHELEGCCTNAQIAFSDFTGTTKLEISPTNYGDHRVLNFDHAEGSKSLHDEKKWEKIEIPVTSVDEWLSNGHINVSDIGLVWIDTQGHEGHILSKANLLLNHKIPIVIEFWPYGLCRSGGYEKLIESLQNVSMIFDMRNISNNESLELLDLSQLDKMYHKFIQLESSDYSPHTDLLLLP
jgi:FkbM family methyltransferase